MVPSSKKIHKMCCQVNCINCQQIKTEQNAYGQTFDDDYWLGTYHIIRLKIVNLIPNCAMYSVYTHTYANSLFKLTLICLSLFHVYALVCGEGGGGCGCPSNRNGYAIWRLQIFGLGQVQFAAATDVRANAVTDACNPIEWRCIRPRWIGRIRWEI